METRDMSKEQLIEYINSQNSQILSLSNSKFFGQAAQTNLPAYYEKLGFLSNASAIGLIITEIDGAIISLNKTSQELLGLSIEDGKKMNIAELYVDPHDRQYMLEMLAKSGTVRDFEVEIKHKDGTLRTVLANIDNIELDNTQVMLSSIYDITQYKQRQKMLQEADKSYRTLFSNVPVGIIVTDIQGDLIISNHAIQELLGYSAEELKNFDVDDFYVIRSERQQLVDLTERLGNVRDFETLYRHKNGTPISVLINTDQIEFNNQSGMLLTSVRDISHLKLIEDELTKERDFSNTLLNIAASLIVVIDRLGTITRFNRACEQTTGYSFAEMRGKYLGDATFIDPDITRAKVDQLLSEGGLASHNSVWLHRNGERHLISWTDSTLLDHNGEVEYVIATGIDITKRQQAEDQLHQANQKLAAWVKELQARTEEMNQLNEMGEQLQSCQTIAEACAISVQYIKQICPDSNGALYLINPSRNAADAAEMWGEPGYTQPVFAPLDCWAIRRGRLHQLDDSHPGLRCGHVIGPQSGRYLCAPLLVNGEAIGILHLNQVAADTDHACYTDHKSQLVMTMAEHIALTLSNLRLRETLRQQSIRDALTGLFNRRYLEETLEREILRAEREERPIGVIMFDIDHFKDFNDLAGHDAGDALLRELGVFLNQSLRGGDIVCRYGGEEFLAILPGISRQDARRRAEELRQGAKELLVYYLGKPLARCTVSLGVAVFPENGVSADALLKAADNALYRAKNSGRDRVELA